MPGESSKVGRPALRPHVVILGAGASRAAFPQGEGTGRKLPMLQELAEEIGLAEVLAAADLTGTGDVETDVTRLYREGTPVARQALEARIHEHFSVMRLPAAPTIYDYLVLSLREKDVVATFNWDPLLWQAARRNQTAAPPPRLIFLHGNVAVGHCRHCGGNGPIDETCAGCGAPRERTPLMCPTGTKDYAAHPAIDAAWREFKGALEAAEVVTVFGYSAPRTDGHVWAAVKEAWQGVEARLLTALEIIDLPGGNAEKVRERWGEFVRARQWAAPRDFFDSRIARQPRRTCEMPGNYRPLPRTPVLSVLQQAVRPLVDEEKNGRTTAAVALSPTERLTTRLVG